MIIHSKNSSCKTKLNMKFFILSFINEKSMKTKSNVGIGLIISLITLLSGCTAFGPRTIMHDRIDYTSVLSETWKSQMLLNIVKIRYGDVPVFLDVASVINSYELSGRTQLDASGQLPPAKALGGDALFEGFYANRPTVTYSPLSGEKFAKSLMAPLPISPILSLIQSGYQVNYIFRVFVQSINGLENHYSGRHQANAGFYQLLDRLKRIQDAGAFGLRFGTENGKEILMVVFGNKNDPEVETDISEVKKMLDLDPHTNEFTVVYGAIQTNDKEIAILSRSMLQVLNDLASYIEVPESDVTENRVNPGFKNEVMNGDTIPPLIKIFCSSQRPDDAFVAIPYQKHWFWIDNKNLLSKQLFSFLMFSFALVETSGKEGVPIVTVPVR
jgi:hypothetical protein